MNQKLVLTNISIALLLTFASCIFAAGMQSDYDRAERLRILTQNKVFRSHIEAHWLADNKSFWYEVQTGENSYEFIFVDAEKGIRRSAFDHERLSKALNAKGIDADAQSLQIENLTFNFDASCLEFEGYQKAWKCNLKTYELIKGPERPVQSLPAYEPTSHPRPKNNGGQTTITFINNTTETVRLFWLTADGDKRPYGTIESKQRRSQHTYAGHLWMVSDLDSHPIAVYQAEPSKSKAVIGIETIKARPDRRTPRNNKSINPSPDGMFEAFIKDHNIRLRDVTTQKETALSYDGTENNMYTRQIFWSPDSTKLVCVQTKKAPPHMVYMVESSPKDQLQPKLHSIEYHKPGDVLDIDQPKLFDIHMSQQIPIDNELFSNPWSITHLRWEPDSSRFTFLYNQRGHQILRIVAVDGNTGNARTILEETSKTFIDYSGKLFYEHLEKTNEIIWQSERDGWNHLYLFDAVTGKLNNQITKGPWVVRNVEKVDPNNRQIWFQAGGMYPDQDPYYIHYCRVNFDGTGLSTLTESNGTHEITFSPDQTYFIDKYSRIDMPPIHELRDSKTGKDICTLEKADWTELLKTGWQIPECFSAKGRDNQTDIYGMILRPTTFDPNNNYPVIENIYAGPQGAFVPKSFHEHYKMQELAELGFILVQIDGMGTSYRSKKFHDVCWKNLKDAGLEDRIKWIKAAAEKYPYMDTARVGIYGVSAGGQSAAAAVLTHGDFYKVAVADCGCHDNRMDKVWWNEQWMGWPVGPEYKANSNVTLANRLQGNLLLIVGELDENVDPASTMHLVNALIKADKDFDMLVIPGAGHGAGEGRYGSRRRADYFVRHLLGVEPRVAP